MAVHLDFDLSTQTFVDSGHKFVAAKSGSLIATATRRHWEFLGSVGERYLTIAVQMRAVNYTNGLTFSGGVRYDPNSRVSLIIAAGQDIGASATVRRGADTQHYFRADLSIHLL